MSRIRVSNFTAEISSVGELSTTQEVSERPPANQALEKHLEPRNIASRSQKPLLILFLRIDKRNEEKKCGKERERDVLFFYLLPLPPFSFLPLFRQTFLCFLFFFFRHFFNKFVHCTFLFGFLSTMYFLTRFDKDLG